MNKQRGTSPDVPKIFGSAEALPSRESKVPSAQKSLGCFDGREKAFGVSRWQIVSCSKSVFAQNLLPFGQSELQKLFCGLKVLCRVFRIAKGFAVMTFCLVGWEWFQRQV